MSNFDNLADKVMRLEWEVKRLSHILHHVNISYLGHLSEQHPLSDPRQLAAENYNRFLDWQNEEIKREELKSQLSPLARA